MKVTQFFPSHSPSVGRCDNCNMDSATVYEVAEEKLEVYCNSCGKFHGAFSKQDIKLRCYICDTHTVPASTGKCGTCDDVQPLTFNKQVETTYNEPKREYTYKK